MNKKLFSFLADYAWVVGLSLVITAATLIWSNPLGMFIAGVIILLVGVAMKAINKEI